MRQSGGSLLSPSRLPLSTLPLDPPPPLTTHQGRVIGLQAGPEARAQGGQRALERGGVDGVDGAARPEG